VEQRQPRPRERDMEETWAAASGAIRDALELSQVSADAIAAIGVTGHGDGLYLVDHEGAPLGPGILSLDSRAFDVRDQWREAGLLQQALELTGQQPYSYAAVSLLKWIQVNEPERYAKIGHVLFCKDWLRLCLTGVPATDPTEASSSLPMSARNSTVAMSWIYTVSRLLAKRYRKSYRPPRLRDVSPHKLPRKPV
jgi:L-xylulokinase